MISGAPPPSPKVPPLLSLCSWCVCPGSLPGTEHQPGSDSGQPWEQVSAFIVWGEGGASSLPSLGASPGTCLPVPTHLFLFCPSLVGMGVRWVTARSLSLKPLVVHYPCRQISLLGDLSRSPSFPQGTAFILSPSCSLLLSNSIHTVSPGHLFHPFPLLSKLLQLKQLLLHARGVTRSAPTLLPAAPPPPSFQTSPLSPLSPCIWRHPGLSGCSLEPALHSSGSPFWGGCFQPV